MSHGHTKISSKGACIYCGRKDTRRTDEHVVPFSLGGQHVLLDASCDSCASVTKRFEQDVAREMWGDARNSYNAPTRRKNQRKAHIVLTDPDNPQRTVKVPYSEYPAAMVFYKMQRAGLLEGMPDTVDMSAMWQFVAVCDTPKAKEFEKRFGIKLTAKFRHVPDSFARLLAKIAYCHTLCALEPSDFRPICVPYILGERRNPSYIVGGTFDLAPQDPDHGYVLNTMGFIEADRLMLMAEIRLFANLQTPTYHVVVGDIRGFDRITAALDKLGPISVLGVHSIPRVDDAASNESHWMPHVSPLPFWTSLP
jgi:HNH endonuclease